jgi:iron complex outermembrane receptor protein
VEQFLLRGSWGQGFRAPSIGELFGSPSRFDQTIFDQCNDYLGQFSVDDGGRGVGNPAPLNIQTNCANNGVPGGYIQFNSQLPVFTEGNTSLQPETSESWNIGAVWRPSMLEGASWSDEVVFELNYTEIKLDQAIQAKDSQAIADLCATTGDAAACATITRASDGSVRAITNPLINVGGIQARYFDIGVTWTSPDWSIGQFSVESRTARLLEFTELVALGNEVAPRALEGTERGSPAKGWPETRSTLNVNWERGDLGATLGGRYTSSLTESFQGALRQIDAVTYWDGQLRWSPELGGHDLTFAVGVNNLLDEDTPGCFSCDVNNMDPNLYDVPGRFGYFRVSIRH